jgi:hypothetical protein
MTANRMDFVNGVETALMVTTMLDATTMHHVLEDPFNLMGLPLADAAAGNAHPDHNRQPFLLDVQCTACKQVGQVAKNCDMLAMAICLERYMKHDMSASICNSIEKEWLNWWKE